MMSVVSLDFDALGAEKALHSRLAVPLPLVEARGKGQGVSVIRQRLEMCTVFSLTLELVANSYDVCIIEKPFSRLRVFIINLLLIFWLSKFMCRRCKVFI